MSPPLSPHIDAATERRLEQTLIRREGLLQRHERVTEAVMALLFLAGAVALAVLAEPARAFSPALAAAFVVAYALTTRVEFVFGDTGTMPTQLLFAPMLLLLPTPLVPLLATAALVLGAAWDVVRG